MLQRIALVLIVVGSFALTRAEAVRYLRWNEGQAVLAGFAAAAGEKAPEIADAKQWDGWIRRRDAEIRAGTDRATENSISILILSGTSFTNLPRLGAASDAVTPAGDLTPATRNRVNAFIDALDHLDSEPFRYILQFLARHKVTQDELRAYLGGNLRRAVLEQGSEQVAQSAALSQLADTAVEETLRRLKMEGKAPANVRRIAVIGPNLDFTNESASSNPFAGLEAALRLGLAKPGNVEVVVLDFNPWILSQIRAAAPKAGAQNRVHISAQDIDVAAQTIDAPANQGFDLVVAMHGVFYRGNLDQALAMANVARMMTSGGILLMKGPSSTLPAELELLTGPGENIAAYRRR